MDKSAIRRAMQARLSNIPLALRQKNSKVICNTLRSLPVIKQARTIALYYPTKYEVAIAPFSEWCWAQDKQVLLPRLRQDQIELLAYLADTKLATNRYGIPEPKQSTQSFAISEVDAVIVPIVGFDRFGYRIGRGGGHYDRLLSSKTNAATVIGAAYQLQQINSLPSEAHDQRLDMVVTEKGVLKAQQ